MAAFAYTLRNQQGRLKHGKVMAISQKEALDQVKKLGGITLSLKQIGEKKGFHLSLQRISLKEKIIFTEQLEVMLKAGITLVQALRGLQEESTNKAMAALLGGVIADLEAGTPLSDSFAKHPKVFSNIYVQMVRSAEKTGNVAGILSKLSVQQQKEYELKGKVKGALMYPAIVSVLLLAVIIMVITFILPKLTGLFTDSGIQLPASTRFLLFLSDFMVHQWYVLIITIVVSMIGFKLALRTTRGLYIWDSFKIRVPVLGTFMRKSYLARFTQSFASLSQAGIPVLEIFKTLEGVIGNSVYEGEIKKISRDVENGIKVSTAIRKSKHFPGMVGQLVSVGEQSGDLAGVFTVLGDFFEKEVDGMAKNLSVILEPIIMIVMGAGVGFVLISVLQPILNLTNAV